MIPQRLLFPDNSPDWVTMSDHGSRNTVGSPHSGIKGIANRGVRHIRIFQLALG